MGIRLGLCAIVLSLFAPDANAALILPVFAPGTPVTQLNSSFNDFATSISGDGLKILLQSGRNPSGDALFSAVRATLSSAFSVPSTAEFVNNNLPGHDVRAGVLSPNGLELFYSDQQLPGGPTQLLRAVRGNTSSPFSSGTPMGGLQVDSHLYYTQFLSNDFSRLYYFNNAGKLFVATRSPLAAPFTSPSSAPFVNIPYSENFYLTPDELELYFSANLQLWWTRRPNLATPFAPPQQITSVTGVNLTAPVIFGDTLFYSSGDDIYQAKMIPVPEPGAAFVALSLVFATGRSSWTFTNRIRGA